MTEIHRVPLLPIAKGSLTKIWLGVLVALLVAAGLVWVTRSHDVRVETLVPGNGPSPKIEDVVQINYVAKLTDGTEFDRGQLVPMKLDEVIPGFGQGITRMQKGGKYRLTIPAEKAYGPEEKRNPQTGKVVIPANSDLVFDVDLLDFKTREEIMRQQQMMQQLQQMQGGAGGPPPGAGAPPPPQ
ncbi:FKBP-type peptidyl-prolyl cis-trans isomerase [Novosphingobium sp. Gsoil 351]|uniref:FKBP-type peptidyl-prolyl cis-trans isomerase n=1 Tax=Novosphingobium sp. Gsoil 351 TaxID=2675225 RepID=UPI0012B4F36C|nr:FKBP-type peptidyl-prolyl cis-trans isomerase [Novosphingobium sp. Gsoil 351]QGN55312.1 FKBP-type peptidyl-prolyl cis-trans isomerase [Novosphingobium sp. Gsoil 351]